MRFPVLKIILFTIIVMILLPLSSVGQRDTADIEPHFLAFDIGAYNVFRGEYIQGLFEVEFYPRWKAWFFYPFAGAFVNTNTKACLFAGITIPIKVKKHLLFRISFAPGLYTASNEKRDLGFLLEFRTSLKLAWIFRNRGRLGIQISHISNANLHKSNPGSEMMVISYEMPLVFKKPGN